MRRGLAALLMLALCAGIPAAHAVETIPQARAYLHRLQSLQARFELRVADESGHEIDRNSGLLHLWRPGRLRWEIAEPHPGLLLIDGRKIWHYDQELEQVTVRKLDDDLWRTPAGLLLEARRLDEHFRTGDTRHDDAGRWWLNLEPLQEESTVRLVGLGFYSGALEQLRLEDHLGQVTLIRFSALQEDPHPDPLLFRFIPPPGVEVLGNPSD